MSGQLGDLGSGAGKGGGGGGSIREAGGGFGKMEAAREEEFFYKQVKKKCFMTGRDEVAHNLNKCEICNRKFELLRAFFVCLKLQQQAQLSKLKKDLHDEINFHEEQIQRHQEAIERHKHRVNDMDSKQN